MQSLAFPSDFVFGVATAAYQVEGHIENDWSLWERAGRLKDPHAKGCGRAVDHWNRFEEDLRLVTDVAATAFRISLEWARIEPVRGHFDEAALEAYRHRLLRMRERGVRPVVTLHHFTHPPWFHGQTPWYDPECVKAFRRYAQACARILEGVDAMVVTFNEPMVLVTGGYLMGMIPPGLSDGTKALAALGNMGRCHVIAREEIRQRAPRTEVGISQNMMVFRPDRWWHPMDRAVSSLVSQAYNHAFLEALTEGRLCIRLPGLASGAVDIPGGRDSMDYLGLNYYTRAHLRFLSKHPFIEMVYRDRHGRGLTHIGWEDFPEGFSRLLLEVKRYGKPVWITENGIDDRRGDRRNRYLHAHWRQLLAARAAGVDVRGYLHWSLLDNFEWLEGWGPRFGLFHVDFETLERRPTPSVPYFREVARTKLLPRPPEGILMQ